MKKWIFFLLIALGIAGLVGVRVVEDRIFYDPFLEYYRNAKLKTELPSVEWGRLIVSHLFRFGLNLFFSVVVLHCVFGNRKWTLQGLLLMVLVFAIVFPIYLYSIYNEMCFGQLFTFYLRRFVIQPVLLLLITPMFYYRKKVGASV